MPATNRRCVGVIGPASVVRMCSISQPFVRFCSILLLGYWGSLQYSSGYRGFVFLLLATLSIATRLSLSHVAVPMDPTTDTTTVISSSPYLGGVNHCSLHCRLATFRGLMRRWKYGFLLSQSQRRISPFSSNHGISPNDSQSARLAYLSWKIEIGRDWYRGQIGRRLRDKSENVLLRYTDFLFV